MTMLQKSCCLRFGPRCDVPCANIITLTGHVLSWTKEAKYLGIFIVQSRAFKCAMMTLNAHSIELLIFGKVGRPASEEVALQLIKSKCIPVLLYGLVVCPLNNSQLSSLDFAMNRFLIKLFSTSYMEIITYCREQFYFELPSVILVRHTGLLLDKLCHCDKCLIANVMHS